MKKKSRANVWNAENLADYNSKNSAFWLAKIVSEVTSKILETFENLFLIIQNSGFDYLINRLIYKIIFESTAANVFHS